MLCASAAQLTLGVETSDAALTEMANGLVKEMSPIGSHQGRGDTKRKQAAVLLKRVLKDMAAQSTHV